MIIMMTVVSPWRVTVFHGRQDSPSGAGHTGREVRTVNPGAGRCGPRLFRANANATVSSHSPVLLALDS